MSDIITSYPMWAYLLCPLAGAVFAIATYYRDKRTEGLSRQVRILLAAFRFAAVTLAVFLLLGPLVRTLDTRLEQPIVVIAADNSGSLILGADSAEVRQNYIALLSELTERLGGSYQVAPYTFGASVLEGSDINFSEPVTDISEVFTSVKNRYSNRNIGAIILASDGIYNRGTNPRYAIGGITAPVYTIALGDTSVKRDARIAEVGINRIAFLGNRFPIEVAIAADKLKGQDLRFSISRQGAVLYSETVQADSDHFSKTIRVLLDADKPGNQQYTIRIAPVQGESILANNTKTVFIEVIDSRQRILILAASPHPDVLALRQAISSNENYRAEARLLSEFDGDLKPYNLVVLHQIPGMAGTGEQVRTQLIGSDIPILAVVGSQSDLPMLSRTGLGVDLAGFRNTWSDPAAIVNQGFSGFTIDPEFNSFLRDAPPLRMPFGTWRVANSAETILYQRIGSIATTDPLLVVNKAGDRKAATLLGEGIWRWRLYDYATEGSHRRFDTFISSLVQYLSLKADKRPFRVQHAASFMENERAIFTAELYNDAFEPVTEPEVSIEIRDEDDKLYSFVFSRAAQAYRLDGGVLPVGNYSYKAGTRLGTESYEHRGSFVVRPFALEAASLTADHNLLYSLAQQTGGKMLYASNAADEISRQLLEEKPLKPISYTTELFNPFINFWWPLLLLILLLAAEWLLRKWSGIY